MSIRPGDRIDGIRPVTPVTASQAASKAIRVIIQVGLGEDLEIATMTGSPKSNSLMFLVFWVHTNEVLIRDMENCQQGVMEITMINGESTSNPKGIAGVVRAAAF